jgi:hypothetical protein
MDSADLWNSGYPVQQWFAGSKPVFLLLEKKNWYKKETSASFFDWQRNWHKRNQCAKEKKKPVAQGTKKNWHKRNQLKQIKLVQYDTGYVQRN